MTVRWAYLVSLTSLAFILLLFGAKDTHAACSSCTVGGDLAGSLPNPTVVGITGVSGAATCNATTLSWIQSGTVGAPNQFDPIKVQPTDTAKAPFAAGLYDQTFCLSGCGGSQDDSIFALGYNVDHMLVGAGMAGEASAGWVVEQNYKVSSTDDRIEAYLELAGGTSGSVRPFIASVQRSTATGAVTLSLPPGSTSYLDVQDNPGNQLLKFFPASFFSPAGAVMFPTSVPIMLQTSYGGGYGLLQIENSSGKLKYTGPSGTVTYLANP